MEEPPTMRFGCWKVQATQIGPQIREHRRSTSSGVHLVNGPLMLSSSRAQKNCEFVKL